MTSRTFLSATVEGLRREFKGLRRDVTDLQRRGDPQFPDREYALDNLTDVDITTDVPSDGDTLVYDSASGLWVPGAPAGGGGGSAVSEAFVADSVGTSTTTISAANTSTAIQFRVSSTNLGRFRTTGVSDMSSAVTAVTLPAGLWALTAQIRLGANAPTSGYVTVHFSYENEWVRVPWSQIADLGSGTQYTSAWLHRTYYLASASAIGFSIFNDLNTSVIASCRMFSGVRLAEHGALTLA